MTLTLAAEPLEAWTVRMSCGGFETAFTIRPPHGEGYDRLGYGSATLSGILASSKGPVAVLSVDEATLRHVNMVSVQLGMLFSPLARNSKTER